MGWDEIGRFVKLKGGGKLYTWLRKDAEADFYRRMADVVAFTRRPATKPADPSSTDPEGPRGQ